MRRGAESVSSRGRVAAARFLFKSRDIQVDKPVETSVLVDWHPEAACHFQGEKAMHHAAQTANGVNSVLLAEPVRCEYGSDNIHHLLRDAEQLLLCDMGPFPFLLRQRLFHNTNGALHRRLGIL
jgi:hypothetical protein